MATGKAALAIALAIACGPAPAMAGAVGCQNNANGSALANVLLTEGNYSPPAYVHPDDENDEGTTATKTTYSNLRLAQQPVGIVCTYADGTQQSYRLPDGTNTCTIYGSANPVTLACQ